MHMRHEIIFLILMWTQGIVHSTDHLNKYIIYEIKLLGNNHQLISQLEENYTIQVVGPDSGESTTILVLFHMKKLLESHLRNLGMSFKDVSREFLKKVESAALNNNIIRKVTRRSETLENPNLIPDVTKYIPHYIDIQNWLSWTANHSDNFCQVKTIGHSYEGRALQVFICSIGDDVMKKKRVIFVEAGIHGREHGAVLTCLYMVKKFIKNLKHGIQNVKDLFSNFDFHFYPVANPDGYEFSLNKTNLMNRFWRKTRKPYGKTFGADANRNFDNHFGRPDTTSNTNAEDYSGPFPFSESETRHLANYLISIRSKIKLYLALHSYGQYWLIPPYHTNATAMDNDDLVRVADAGIQAITKINGNQWKVGQPSSPNILNYSASGTSVDWVRDKLKVKYAYTLETSPNESLLNKTNPREGGFIFSPKHIAPSGNEIYAALLAVTNAIKSLL